MRRVLRQVYLPSPLLSFLNSYLDVVIESNTYRIVVVVGSFSLLTGRALTRIGVLLSPGRCPRAWLASLSGQCKLVDRVIYSKLEAAQEVRAYQCCVKIWEEINLQYFTQNHMVREVIASNRM